MKTVSILKPFGPDYERVLALYGGESVCKEHFPATYAILQNPAVDANSSIDITLRILSAGYKTGERNTIAVTAELCASSAYYCRLEAYANRKDDPSIEIAHATGTEFFGDYVSVGLEIPAQYRDNCIITLFGVDVSKQVRLLRLAEDLSDVGLLEDEVTFTVKHPVVLNAHPAPDTGKIVLSFLHRGTFAHADYAYQYYNGPFKLPSSGSILLDGYTFDDCEASLSVTHVVTNVCMYHAPLARPACSGSTMTWNLPEDWGFQLTSFGMASSDLIYTLHFDCHLRGEQGTFIFIVTNNPQVKKSPQNHKIEDMRYYRDCIVAGALVMLDSGLTLPIERVEAGQILRGGSKVIGILSGAIVGGLRHLTVLGGRGLAVSASHHMLTDKGYLPAEHLTVGARLVMDGGDTAELERIVPLEGGNAEIYNLLLEGGDGNIIANGFVVQGITPESMQAPSRAAQRAYIDPNWLTDFDSLCKQEAGEVLCP